ncbi:MAG: hypothetical protein ABIT23_00040, partial [Nitrosospira sp.]
PPASNEMIENSCDKVFMLTSLSIFDFSKDTYVRPEAEEIPSGEFALPHSPLRQLQISIPYQ